MKVIVLGAAAHMAQLAINYLNELSEIKDLTLVDMDDKYLSSIAKDLDDKINISNIDVTNEAELKEVIEGGNLVINFVGPYYRFGTKILKTVIEMGVDYIDICDDYVPTQEALKLNEYAKEKDVTALVGMGVSPGITNVLAKLGSDAMTQPEIIDTYWLAGDANPSGHGALVHMFHIIEGKVPTFLNGNFKNVRAFQKSTSRTINFGDPVGVAELYQVGHPEPITLSKFIPGVQNVTNYGALLPAGLNGMFKHFVDFGLTSETPIEFKGIKITPIEFLLNMFDIRQNEISETRVKTYNSVSGIGVNVKGLCDDLEVEYIFRRSSSQTMQEVTSTPVGVVASLLLTENTPRGVIAPECLNPKLVLSTLKEKTNIFDTGIFEVTRKIGEEVTIGCIFDNETFPELWEN